MTVTYTSDVTTSKNFGSFCKVLFRWRGSIYKLVWIDLLVFMLVYYALGFVYRFALTPQQKIQFESVVHYFESSMALIPLSFVLGFFVSIVMTRWWEQYMAIPWPDSIAVFVSAHIHGQDDRARLMRRTIMRYVCLTQAMVFSLISPKVKKRFPTMNHYIEVGLLVENERLVFESMDESFPKHSKYWMPIVWAASIVTRARKEGRIRDDFAVKTIVDELNKFRGRCQLLLLYDLIPIPLVYTQVVTVAVYSFFLGCVLGMQWTEADSNNKPAVKSVNYWVPFFSILQFFFYMGWLKVAETLINPFGEDDDDFEVNWMIDRNLQVSYLIVDEMHQEHPELVKDQFWDQVFPSELPYDKDVKRGELPEPSTTKMGEKLKHPSLLNLVANGHRFNQEQLAEQRELLKRLHARSSLSSIVFPDTDSVYRFRDAENCFGMTEYSEGCRFGGEEEDTDMEGIEIYSEMDEEEEDQGIPKVLVIPPTQTPTSHRVIFEAAFESSSDTEFSRTQDTEAHKTGSVVPPETFTAKKEEPVTSRESVPETGRKEEPSTSKQEEPSTSKKEESPMAKKEEPVHGRKEEPTAAKKDDFERLREERERERIERQRMRFVQNMADVTMVTKRKRPMENPSDSDIYIFEEFDYIEEEGDEEEGEEHKK